MLICADTTKTFIEMRKKKEIKHTALVHQRCLLESAAEVYSAQRPRWVFYILLLLMIVMA